MFTTRSQTRALASESDLAHAGPPRIAYIVSRFPKLTETFVLYEAVQMEKLGVCVDIFPLMRERECVVHDEAGEFVERARFHSYFSLAMLRAQLHFIKHSPQAYGKAFSEVLRGTFGSLKFFVGALCFFPKAVCFAY